MTSDTRAGRYHVSTVALHWLMLLLFVAVYASINVRELFDKGSAPRELLKSLHFMLGLSVFALVWLRVALRLKFAAPAIEPAPALWQALASKLGHWALYGFMLGMPLLGWCLLSAAGKPIPFFGLELPALIAPDKALASQIKEVHEAVGELGYFLIAAHAVAALLHHYLRRDNTLRRMWFSA